MLMTTLSTPLLLKTDHKCDNGTNIFDTNISAIILYFCGSQFQVRLQMTLTAIFMYNVFNTVKHHLKKQPLPKHILICVCVLDVHKLKHIQLLSHDAKLGS